MAGNIKVDKFIDTLRTRILAGEFGDNGRLPSFRALASEYGTTQETMNKTMHALQAEGLLISMGAKGVFVNNTRMRIPGIVMDFSLYLKNRGLEPKSEFIGKPEIIEPTKEIKQKMNLKKGQLVFKRQRRQGANNSFYRIATEYYPAQFINDQMLEQIHKDPHFSIILAIKKNFEKTIQLSEEELIARLPTAFEQEQLQIVRTNPVIEIKNANFTADKNTAILYYHKILNANHFTLYYNNVISFWE